MAAVLALGATLASGNATYEERLLDISAGRSVSREVLNITRGSPELRALFVDLSADRELHLKMLLAIEKYGDAAKEVLTRFGHLPEFQAQLRDYGERVVPVVAYFVKHDIASLRGLHRGNAIKDSAVQSGQDLACRWWGDPGRPECVNPAQPTLGYDETFRGLYAIDRIKRDRHGFLGQFDINKHGQAHWNQTERIGEMVEEILMGGVRDLETKYRLNEPISASDYVWAATDVLVGVSAVKAVKFLKAQRSLGVAGKEVGVLERTTLMGRRALLRDTWGKRLIKYGPIAGTAYLVAQHPGLLSSLFVEIGKWLGLPPFLAMFLGWLLVACGMAMVLLPLLPGLLVLVPLSKGAAKFSYWVMARRNLKV